jgi:hypothetical protein
MTQRHGYLHEGSDLGPSWLEHYSRFEELGSQALQNSSYYGTEILGFHEAGHADWVAELECGHRQHVRHDRAFQD